MRLAPLLLITLALVPSAFAIDGLTPAERREIASIPPSSFSLSSFTPDSPLLFPGLEVTSPAPAAPVDTAAALGFILPDATLPAPPTPSGPSGIFGLALLGAAVACRRTRSRDPHATPTIAMVGSH
jgi:hypothetical protein